MWPSPEVHSMTSSQNTKWPWMNWIKSQGGRKLGHRRRCGVGTSQCWKHFSLLLSSKFLLAIVATWSGPTLAWMTLWFKICRSQVLFLSCYAQKLLVQFWIGYICAAPAVFRRLVVIVLLGAVFRRLLVLHRQRQSIWRKPCAQTPDSSTAWLFWGPRLQFQRFGWHHVYIVAGTYWWDGHTTTWPWGGLCILCIPLSTLKTKKTFTCNFFRSPWISAVACGALQDHSHGETNPAPDLQSEDDFSDVSDDKPMVKTGKKIKKKVHIRRDSYVFYDLKHSGL